MTKVRVLGIVGSPRKGGNTELLVREALAGAESVDGVETRILVLADMHIGPCIGCYSCSAANELCTLQFQDDMHLYYDGFLWADGLIIGSPVFHLSVPGVLKNAIDRLGMGLISRHRQEGLPWYCKAGGVLTQGVSRLGGQEYVMQFLIAHLLLMNCLVVSPDSQIGIGVAGSLGDHLTRVPGAIAQYDPDAVRHSRVLGRRVAEVARIISSGVAQLGGNLPPEYEKYVLRRGDTVTDSST